MKSRLKEIKDNHEFGKGEGWELTILSEDIDWLIAEVERLNSRLSELVCAIYEHANEGTSLMELAEKIDNE
jgi:hypothetical protein